MPEIELEPLVSVVVPTHNRAALLRHAIHSVLAQTYAKLELVIVDDASTDTTTEVVEAIRDPRLRYIRLTENRRAAHARNVGIRESRGSLVAFNDDDDLWLIEKLEKQVEHLRASPLEVGVSISGHIRLWKDRSHYVGGQRLFEQLDFTRGFLDDLDVSLAATPGWLARREVLKRVGGFDERMRCWDDWELASRLSRVCRFAHLNEPLFLQERRRPVGGGMWDDLPNFVNDYMVIIEKQRDVWTPSDLSKNFHQVARAAQAAGDRTAARAWLEKAVRAYPLNLRATADLLRARLARRIDIGKRAGFRPSARMASVESSAVPSDAPLVSVILPTHDRTDALSRALASVVGQSWRNLEVIVVDDGPADRTAELTAGSRDRRLRYVRSESHRGAVALRNTGLGAASGEFVAFLDANDEWVAGRLEQQMALFAKNAPQIVLVGGTLQRYDRIQQRSVTHHWTGSDPTAGSSAVDRRRFIDGLTAFLQTAVVRRDAIERAGRFDETMTGMEDFELCLRLLDQGKFHALSAVMTVSHPRPDSPFENVAERAGAMRRIVAKYGRLFGDSREAMFWSWYTLAHSSLAAGDAMTSARAAREAAGYKPGDPRPWIIWALMTTAPTLGPRTVRTVRRTRALLGV